MQVTDTEESELLPKTCIGPQLNKDSAEVVWGGMPYKELVHHVEKIYDCMTVFKKNLFKLPSGGAGKEFVLELAFWTRQFNKATKLNGIALKVLMIIPNLLLQKPSPKSKAKQHLQALERRLLMWRAGELTALLRESKHIQDGFSLKAHKVKSSESLSKKICKVHE